MIEKIKQAHPFPSLRPDYQPFNWKLDGGGRNLVLNLLAAKDISVMLEIGVLYGGSALQWLKHKNNLTVIGVDPWEFSQDQVIYWWENRRAYGLVNLDQGGMNDDAFIEQLLRPDAAFFATLSNLWDYRDRFVPVRGKSPEKLYELSQLGLTPNLVYFDSDKKLDDLWTCHELWPSALICGDDWTWSPSEQCGTFPVQDIVKRFAHEHNMTINSEEATWCLLPN